MRIIHISDTHSLFPTLPEGDIIIHSGDMLPNSTRGNKPVELKFQEKWLNLNINKIQDWIEDKPFYFCAGNHDWINPVPILKSYGIDAYDLTYKYQEVPTKRIYNKGPITLYGFPDVPYMCGEWNFESKPYEMSSSIRRLKDVLENRIVDVLVAHAPPFAILDYIESRKEMAGNEQMRDFLFYELKEQHRPKYYLCGHIHQKTSQVAHHFGITFTNSATNCTVIEI